MAKPAPKDDKKKTGTKTGGFGGLLPVLGFALAAISTCLMVAATLDLKIMDLRPVLHGLEPIFAIFLIAGSSLLTALALVGRRGWPDDGFARVAGMTMVIGFGYTIYSEWLNTAVRVSWTYSELMPVVPWIGTGLSPLAQWLVVPTVALWAARWGSDRSSAGAVGAVDNRQAT